MKIGPDLSPQTLAASPFRFHTIPPHFGRAPQQNAYMKQLIWSSLPKVIGVSAIAFLYHFRK